LSWEYVNKLGAVYVNVNGVKEKEAKEDTAIYQLEEKQI